MKGHIAKGELVVQVELIFKKTTIQEFFKYFNTFPFKNWFEIFLNSPILLQTFGGLFGNFEKNHEVLSVLHNWARINKVYVCQEEGTCIEINYGEKIQKKKHSLTYLKS